MGTRRIVTRSRQHLQRIATLPVAALGLALALSGAPGPLVTAAPPPANAHAGVELAPTPSTTTAPPVDISTGAPASERVAPAPPPLPTGITIAAVGIDSSLVELGLNPDHTLEVPDDFATAGWYVFGPVPGEPGPSVIAGHVDSREGPAIFYRLREVEPGSHIDVTRSDGSTAEFVVTAREQHDKDEFPTQRVYGPTTGSELRVITCGGSFDRSIGHYNDNVILFAELVQIT